MSENNEANSGKSLQILAVVLLVVAVAILGWFAYNNINKTSGTEKAEQTASSEPKFEEMLTEGDPVVAKINGSEIKRSEVLKYIDTLPEEAKQGTEQPKLFYIALNQLINLKLIDQNAAKSDVVNSPEFIDAVNKMITEHTREAFIDDYINKHITEDVMKAEYEKQKAQMDGKQEVHAKHILVNTKEEAEDIIKQLDNGASFEELAKEKSNDPTGKRGGDLGWFIQTGELVQEFADAAFAIPPGEYSKEPVQTTFGWHVIKVEGKRDRKFPSYEELKPTIKEVLGRQAVNDLLRDISEKATIEAFDFNGNPLEQEEPAPAAPAATPSEAPAAAPVVAPATK